MRAMGIVIVLDADVFTALRLAPPMTGRAKNSARPQLCIHSAENRAGFEPLGGSPFFDSRPIHALNPTPWMLLHARRGSNPARI